MNAYKIAIEAIEAVNTGRINGKEFEERIAPLRDVEAVVHCKDCKHGEPGACGYGIDCEGIWHDDDWFCADGEKAGKRKAQKQN